MMIVYLNQKEIWVGGKIRTMYWPHKEKYLCIILQQHILISKSLSHTKQRNINSIYTYTFVQQLLNWGMMNPECQQSSKTKSAGLSSFFNISSNIKEASAKLKPQSLMIIGEIIGIFMGLSISSLFNKIHDSTNSLPFFILSLYLGWKFVVLCPCLFFVDQKAIAKSSFWLEIAIISSVLFCFRKIKGLLMKMMICFLQGLRRLVDYILVKMTNHLENASRKRNDQKEAEQGVDYSDHLNKGFFVSEQEEAEMRKMRQE